MRIGMRVVEICASKETCYVHNETTNFAFA